MAKYSSRSLANLQSAHPDLQTLFHYVIESGFDNTVSYGLRTAETQFGLFKRGREKINGIWTIVDRKKVVTYKDGYDKKSKHQGGYAVDVVPYHPNYPHIRWDDIEWMYYFGGYVMGIAEMLKKYGAIEHSIRYGGDWDRDHIIDDQTFMDLIHFEIINNN